MCHSPSAATHPAGRIAYPLPPIGRAVTILQAASTAAKKDLRPSTTRKGTDLPSRPHFLPQAAATPATKKQVIVHTSSPLSIMSTSNEKDLLDVDKDKQGAPDLSKSMSDEHIESEFEDGELLMKSINL
jgi:hypothetical protein